MRKRFDFNVSFVYSQKSRRRGKFNCTLFSPKQLGLLSLLNEVKRGSLDHKMIKLTTLENVFPPVRQFR